MIPPFTDLHTHSREIREETLRIVCVDPREPAGPLPPLFSAGIHPKDGEIPAAGEMLEKLEKMLGLPGACAAGECGMDRFSPVPMEKQEELFSEQVKLAEAHEMPVILHGVRCWPEIIRIRKQSRSECLWAAHGFRSSLENCYALLDHGILPSFGEALLFDPRCGEVLAALPADSFLLETDAGSSVPETIYEAAGKIRKMSLSSLKEQVYSTFRRVFPNL